MVRVVATLCGALFCTALTGAFQAPAPPSPAPQGPVHQVAYVDVLPASRSEAVAAFNRYREAARKETGFARLDVFEQIGRAGHFSVVEAWADAASLEGHARASHTRALLDTLRRIGVSGYDERPYVPLSVAPPRDSGPRAVHVVTHVDTIPAPGSDGPGLLRRLAEASRLEPGNLRFDVLQHAMRRNHFTLVESWASPAAADAHAAAMHTRQYRLDVQPLSGSPIDERLFTMIP